MKELILVLGLIFWMLGAMAQTQAYGKRVTTKIQNSSGIDAEYEHGEWCIDGRSF